MYKKRFAKWGFHKNARRSRSREGQDPEAMAVALCSSKAIPRTAPRVIRLDASDTAQAFFLSNIKTWGLSFFELASPLSPTAPGTGGIAPEQLSFSFRVVVGLLQRDQGTLAGRLARKAFIQAEGLLQGEGPLVVWNILDIFRNIAANCQAALGNMLLDHLVGLAHDAPLAAVLQSFRGMVRAWEREGVPVRHDALEKAWAMNADLLFSRFDPKYLLMYYRLVWDSDLVTMGPEISALVDGWFGRLHERMDDTRVGALASIDEEPEPLADVAPVEGFDALKSEIIAAIREKAAQTHSDPVVKVRVLSALLKSRILEDDAFNPRDADLDFSRLQARIMAYVAKVVASIDEKETQHAEASIPWARMVLALREFGQDPTGPQTVAEMWRLEELLSRAGHVKEAARLREESYRRLEQYLADVPEDAT
jgi:hypothetical protein